MYWELAYIISNQIETCVPDVTTKVPLFFFIYRPKSAARNEVTNVPQSLDPKFVFVSKSSKQMPKFETGGLDCSHLDLDKQLIRT